MEKIKIVGREYFNNGSYHTVYDVYVGFTGMPSTWPFMTKWIVDKTSLNEDELLKYMKTYITTGGKTKISVKLTRVYD